MSASHITTSTSTGTKNTATPIITLFINVDWAFFISSSLDAITAFAKSNIPSTIISIGTIILTYCNIVCIKFAKLSGSLLLPNNSVQLTFPFLSITDSPSTNPNPLKYCSSVIFEPSSFLYLNTMFYNCFDSKDLQTFVLLFHYL